MKLNNHVPHKLKKRVLKKAYDLNGNVFQNSHKYYETLKIAKMVNRKAYKVLKERLRIRGILKMHEEESFTGRVIAEFRWNGTPEGVGFWSKADKEILEHQYDNAYHKRKGAKK